MARSSPFRTLALDNASRKTLLTGPCENGMYPLYNLDSKSISTSKLAFKCQSPSSKILWHLRLGHPSNSVFNFLSSNSFIPVSSYSNTICDHCAVAKSHKLMFHESMSVVNHPFALIHSDVWGPSPISSFNGYQYYLVFIDEFTKFCWIYPLKLKSEVPHKFMIFQAMVKTQFNSNINVLRTENGGEFINKRMQEFLATQGTIHQTTCPHTPEQNGVAERKHRHLIETTIALLHQAHLPTSYWLEALFTAVYLINRIPTSVLNQKTPYECLFGKPPDYSHLRVFGSLCYPWLRPYMQHKLQPRSSQCVFLGYSPQTKGYRCLDIATNKVYISRHVQFQEDIFPLQHSSISASTQQTLMAHPLFVPLKSTNTVHIQDSSSTQQPQPEPTTTSTPELNTPPSPLNNSGTNISPSPSPPNTVPPPPPPPPISHKMVTRSQHGITKPKKWYASVDNSNSLKEPTSFTEANHGSQWRQAMSAEFNALMSQGTWDLVPLPPNRQSIGCKWIYKIKHNADGTVARYKARLVAKGYHQEYGLDYHETFSPVVKQPTIRLVLSMALHFSWEITQLDVSNAFLHGSLEEEVYMMQPQGFIDKQFPHHVCKLKKAIYGLKQAPRAWFSLLSQCLTQLGFNPSLADPSLFVSHSTTHITIILVYVDDILITGSSMSTIKSVIQQMKSKFAMKELGSLSYFLGIEAHRNHLGLLLNQTKYASDLLEKAGMSDCKPYSSPTASKYNPLTPEDELDYPDVTQFRSIVGALQYLTLTRPEISYAVNTVCQHMHCPKNHHFNSVKRILRYIKGTLNHGLQFTASPLNLTAYCDADWAGDSKDRRSTSGFCIFLGNNLVSWCSKKQHTIAKSSTEAEYKSLSQTAAEISWITMLLQDLHIPTQSIPLLYCDNVSAISLASNPIFHARSKHIEVDFHFVREKIASKQLQVCHISSIDQVADVFTKAISITQFKHLKSKLTVGEPPISLRGDLNGNKGDSSQSTNSRQHQQNESANQSLHELSVNLTTNPTCNVTNKCTTQFRQLTQGHASFIPLSFNHQPIIV